MISPEEVNKVLAESDCLLDAEGVNKVLEQLASQVTTELEKSNPVVLCVMTGGVIPTGNLLSKISFPLQQDYIHATRYLGEISGSELHWLKEPSISLEGRTVLVIDDIFDEGITLKEICNYCDEKGAADVKSLVIVNKLHDRKVAGFKPDYVGVDIEDRYLFGFGMDYKTYLRNLHSIHAVKGL